MPSGADSRQWSCSPYFPSASPEAMFVLPSAYVAHGWAGLIRFLFSQDLEEGQRKPPAARCGSRIGSLVSQGHHLWATLTKHTPDSRGSQSSASERGDAGGQSRAAKRLRRLKALPRLPAPILSLHCTYAGAEGVSAPLVLNILTEDPRYSEANRSGGINEL